MKCQLIFRAGLLLLWILTASVSCADPVITVSEVSTGIKLLCGEGSYIQSANGDNVGNELNYMDENTGEYTCVLPDKSDPNSDPSSDPSSDSSSVKTKIFVKFRTCDNCIELDWGSIAGIVIGDVVATIGIGWAVYLVASQARTSPVPSQKKSSDRRQLLNESRDISPDYQPLKLRQRDTYDVLKK